MVRLMTHVRFYIALISAGVAFSIFSPAQAQVHGVDTQAARFSFSYIAQPKPVRSAALIEVQAKGLNLSLIHNFKARNRALQVEDGCAQWYGGLARVRPFFAGKNSCLGGRAPLAELVKMDLLDHFDHRFSMEELAAKRPMQTRTGFILQMDKNVQIGMSYTFTSFRNDDARRLNQLLPYSNDLAGHRMVLRLRTFWR